LVLWRKVPDVPVDLDGELQGGVGEVEAVRPFFRDKLTVRERKSEAIEQAAGLALKHARVGDADKAPLLEESA
jgi:hypothetical protein